MPNKTDTAYLMEGQAGISVRIYARNDEEAVRFSKNVLGKQLVSIWTLLDAKKENYRVVWSAHSDF